LVHDPDLLLLDEPTNGMDPQGRQTMLSLISDLGKAGISVLLSSHLLPDVERVCERVIIMGGGEVLTTGRIDEMSEAHHTLYSVEFRGDGASLVSRLKEQKVSVLEQLNGRLNIELPAEGAQAVVFEAARKAGAMVCGLHPKRSSLEETFMAALKRQGGA
ncbi:MAG: ABC transporter ATP-binding protein, partial [Planctomycetes bacterium]|nr:ABC transporter ATP-binding protein [Planctomycetota bacterium]